MDIELRHLKSFIAVAEEHNISRAARRLHISQPPLTRQIHQLEQQLGTPLFLRSARGVELTEAGRIFLADGRRILATLGQARDRARSAGSGQLGRLDIAVFGSVMLDVVPELIARFRASHPAVEIVFHTMNKRAQIEALRQHRITLGFSRRSSGFSDIAQRLVKTERLLAAMPRSHALASKRQLCLHQLADSPLILFANGDRPNFADVVFGLYQQAKLQPRVCQTVEDALTGVTLAASGLGICLVPAAVSLLQLPGVSYVPIAGIPAGTVDLYCTYRRDDDTPVTRAFLQALDELMSQATAIQPTR